MATQKQQHTPRWQRYMALLKFEHTLFALPFAYVGMLLATHSFLGTFFPNIATFLWITVAMVGARTGSMALNRLIDAKIDAKNPRTADRELPSGRLKKRDAYLLAIGGFLLLIVAGWALNPLTLALLPVALIFLTLYPYSKRFTQLCHYILGITIGAAAAGGWIAVTGSFAPAAFTLWIGVALWIAGFDILYAVLDYKFDREHGIHSVPADCGVARALTISLITHIAAWGFLALTMPLAEAGIVYLVGVLIVGGIFWWQHQAIRRDGVDRVLRAFNANLWVGGIMLLAVMLDVFFRF